jgi:hypothetical protein
MVTNALVNLPSEAREAGWHLWDALQNEPDLQIAALFWAEFDEADWRIYVVTPLVNERGSGPIYGALREIIARIPEDETHGLDVSDIVVADPEERFVREIRRRYGPTVGDRRTVRRLALSAEEAYVYYIA